MNEQELKALQSAIKDAVESVAPGVVADAVEAKTTDLTESFKAIQDQFKQIIEDSKFTDAGKEAEKAEQIETAGKIFKGILNGDSVNEEGKKILTNTVDSTGGALVPTEFYRTLVKEVEVAGIARRLCRIIPMSSNTKDIPALAGSITAYVVGGGVAITASNPTFDAVQLSAKKFAVLVHAWNELIDDNATNQDIFDLVIDLAKDAFAVLEDTQVLAGNGSGNNFEGVIENADVNVTTLSTTSITSLTFQKLVDCVMSVEMKYKRGKKPGWVMSQLAFGECLKLTDDQNHPIMLRDLTDPLKYTMLGFPVEITDVFGTTDAADTDYIVFGDLKYYAMGDRKAITAETGYNDDNFAKDVKSLKIIERVAGKMLYGEAFGKIKTAAA